MDERRGRGWRRILAGRLPGLALAVLAAACGDAATDPASHTVEVVEGGSQRGLEGRLLPERLVVRAVDGGGAPVAGESATAEVRAGGGTVTVERRTDFQGRAAVQWRLGPADVADQSIAVRVGDAEILVHARALPEEAGDLLVVRNAAGPLKGVVLLRPRTDTRAGEVVEEVLQSDTLVRIQPRAEPLEVIVFPWDNPPERTFHDGTGGLDTLTVALREPVVVDFTVYVTVPVALDEKLAELNADLDALRFVNHAEGLGIAIGDVEVVDLTAKADTTGTVSGPDACRNPGPVDAVNVHYVWRIVQYWGYACPPGLVFMSHQRRPTAPYLFPHEMGHVFGLNHTDGLMDPSATAWSLKEGQILRAHYLPWSGLNQTFGAVPPEAQDPCVFERCLPLDYALAVTRPDR